MTFSYTILIGMQREIAQRKFKACQLTLDVFPPLEQLIYRLISRFEGELKQDRVSTLFPASSQAQTWLIEL